jgi:TonB family protein
LADIFISYSSSDRPKAKALAEAIQHQGWSVWWDRKIPFGKSFDQVIEQELDAARCVIVVWTNASVASHWVKTEAAEGARRQVLLPVLMDDAKIPLEFRRLQAANLIDWQPALPNSEFDQLLTYIGEKLGRPLVAETSGAESGRVEPIPNSASVAAERSQKIAREEPTPTATMTADKITDNPLGMSAELGKSDERKTAHPSAQEENDSATAWNRRIQLDTSESSDDFQSSKPRESTNHSPGGGPAANRNKLLIVGGVATLLILFFIIAFKPDRRTSTDSPQEPLRATVADRQSTADRASTVPPMGTTTDSPPPENKQESSKIMRKSADALQRLVNKRVEPTYPPIARSARVSGSVVVEVTMDEQGNVTSARAISGHPLLQQAAVEAAKGWKFSPLQLSDTPVKEIRTITFNFKLE